MISESYPLQIKLNLFEFHTCLTFGTILHTKPDSVWQTMCPYLTANPQKFWPLHLETLLDSQIEIHEIQWSIFCHVIFNVWDVISNVIEQWETNRHSTQNKYLQNCKKTAALYNSFQSNDERKSVWEGEIYSQKPFPRTRPQNRLQAQHVVPLRHGLQTKAIHLSLLLALDIQG